MTTKPVSAIGVKQASLKCKDGPVVWGNGDQVLERESSKHTVDRGSKGPFKIPKAKMNLDLERSFPTLLSWHTQKMIIRVLCMRLQMRLFKARGESSRGSNHSRGPPGHCEVINWGRITKETQTRTFITKRKYNEGQQNRIA